MNAIFTRTSIRRFASRDVEAEKIDYLMKAAFAAPSAVNQQPWEFYVVTNREILQRLSGVSPYAGPAANAPAAIVVCYRSEGLAAPMMAEIDCAIATENIWLACEEVGLGGVMLGIAPVRERMDAVAKILNLPDNLTAFTVFPFGYPEKKREQKDRYDASRIHHVK